MSRFLPAICPEARHVALEGGTESKEKNRRLEFHLWLIAWKGYALAAAVMDQVIVVSLWCVGVRHSVLCKLPFDAAMKHE